MTDIPCQDKKPLSYHHRKITVDNAVRLLRIRYTIRSLMDLCVPDTEDQILPAARELLKLADRLMYEEDMRRSDDYDYESVLKGLEEIDKYGVGLFWRFKLEDIWVGT